MKFFTLDELKKWCAAIGRGEPVGYEPERRGDHPANRHAEAWLRTRRR